MGYILFLTKHHDGFCLWDTKTTDRKVTNSPLGIDVLAKLRKSCDKYGIKLALYFSEGDWNWPGAVDGKGGKGGSNPEMKKAQLKELLTEYGPIEYIWFDHAVGDGGLSHKETVAWCTSSSPAASSASTTASRQGPTSACGEMGRPGPLGDTRRAGVQQASRGRRSRATAWPSSRIRSCPAIAAGRMWFYSLPKHDNLCQPAEPASTRTTSGPWRYGNIFSLDVGPNYAGKLRDIDVKTLKQVGDMIRAGNATKPQPAEK